MNSPIPFAPARWTPARTAADPAATVASRDGCGVLVGEADAVAAVLDRAVRELHERRVRCVRVSAASAGVPVSSGLVAQVAGRPASGAFTDADLESGVPGVDRSRRGIRPSRFAGRRCAHPVAPGAALPAIRPLPRPAPALRVRRRPRPGRGPGRGRRLVAPPVRVQAGPVRPGRPGGGRPASFFPGRARRAGVGRAARRASAGLALVASLAVWATWREDVPVPSGTVAQVYVPVEDGADEALAVPAVWPEKAPLVRLKAAEVDHAPGRAGHAFAEQGRAGREAPLAPRSAVSRPARRGCGERRGGRLAPASRNARRGGR